MKNSSDCCFFFLAEGDLFSMFSSGKPGKKHPEDPAESPPSVWRVNPVYLIVF